jgi:hypothetical protein
MDEREMAVHCLDETQWLGETCGLFKAFMLIERDHKLLPRETRQ